MTNVFVNDTNNTFRFYTKVLEFQKLMHIPESNLAIIVSKDSPNRVALLLELDDNTIAKTYQTDLFNAGLQAIGFGTENIDSEYIRLQKLGVKFV